MWWGSLSPQTRRKTTASPSRSPPAWGHAGRSSRKGPRLPQRLDDQPVLHEDRDQHTIPFAVVADIGRRRDVADDGLDAVAFQLEDCRRAPRGDEQRASRPYLHTVQVTRGERPDFPLCAAWTEGVHFPGWAKRHHDQSAIGQDGDAVGRVEVGALHHHREFSGWIDLVDRI